ncbi:MAG: LysE family translocator [Boseongicola sp.]|nr:MAG: LysE family translocator [Boseongicola sp.]
MLQSFVLPLAGFAFVMSITPGPNNLMLMASGANFGFRRTVPHMLGVGFGFIFLAFMTGIGLAKVFEAFPWLHNVFTVVCLIYMLWLAWRIANAAPPEKTAATGTPMTFLQAVAFQWVNPKAIAMALSAVTIYAPGDAVLDVLAVVLIFGSINLPSVSLWCVLGLQMRRLLTNQTRLVWFNRFMAFLLILSMYPVLA